MERSEKLITIWNGEYPDYPLTLPDLKKAHSMMGAYLEVFNRLGIDEEAILSPPPEDERDDHTLYYWDLVPVINMTWVINHLISVFKQVDKLAIRFPLKITNLLQPDAMTAHSILLLLVNLASFNENRLREVSPHVEELFGKIEQVKSLEERKCNLLVMLNARAEEKAKQADRLVKLNRDMERLDEDLKQEKETHNEEKLILDEIMKEKSQVKVLVEQKKVHKEALYTKVAKKKDLRVYDADDIKAQAQQATLNVQEADRELESLGATLNQKENRLNILQQVKHELDLADNLVNEVMRVCDMQSTDGDLETDSKEGELDVLSTELSDLQIQLADLTTARQEFNAKRTENQAKRQLSKTHSKSALREADEVDKRCRERSKKASQHIKEIKDETLEYEQEQSVVTEEFNQVKEQFINAMKSFDEYLLNKADEAKNCIQKKLRNFPHGS